MAIITKIIDLIKSIISKFFSLSTNQYDDSELEQINNLFIEIKFSRNKKRLKKLEQFIDLTNKYIDSL